MAMSKLSSTRLDSGNSLRSNYFKLPGNVAWLTSCLPLPPAASPSCLEAYVRHVGVSVSLSVCVWVSVCVCCNSYWSMAATPTAVPWRLCRHRRPIGTDRAACLACLRGTCHTPHATRRRRMPHTPHALRLVKLLILLPATLIFNK